MDEDVDSLVGNETFIPVPPPQDREIVEGGMGLHS